jgi:hypothetical protein
MYSGVITLRLCLIVVGAFWVGFWVLKGCSERERWAAGKCKSEERVYEEDMG